MKKIFLTILISALTLVSCSDDNDNDKVTYDKAKGYLTNLASVKHGIVGVWQPYSSYSCYNFSATGQVCWGFSVDKMDSECAKYEIIQKSNIFYVRGYQIGDTEGTGSYLDHEINTLNETDLIYGESTRFRRYTK